MDKRVLVRWGAAVAAAAGLFVAGFGLYYVLVREGVLRYNRYDRRERGTLKKGDAAPDLALAGYAAETVRLSELWRERPVVLIFGSCT
ncbi:MAG TPA: hypothetical protein VFO85_00660 [Vicinamibacteria bacterium]|nr:hypothetical protein [Vicinamibacteria bacterium]